MTIFDWLKHAEDVLTKSGSPDPRVDARWMAEDLLSMNAAALRFEGSSIIEDIKLADLNACLNRRSQGEPLQYILQKTDFMGMQFYVDSRVLIPRQDTESLVEAAIVALQGKKNPRVLDLCTGSGAIGLSICTLVPGAQVTLADISNGALDVARKNAHSLSCEVTLRHGDLFAAVGREQYDLIASNPPYIPTEELEELQAEVRHEPALALDGGADGLDFYRRIAGDAPQHLLPGGSIYLEVGAGEAQDVLQLLREHINYADSGIIRDLCGIERIVWARSK